MYLKKMDNSTTICTIPYLLKNHSIFWAFSKSPILVTFLWLRVKYWWRTRSIPRHLMPPPLRLLESPGHQQFVCKLINRHWEVFPIDHRSGNRHIQVINTFLYLIEYRSRNGHQNLWIKQCVPSWWHRAWFRYCTQLDYIIICNQCLDYLNTCPSKTIQTNQTLVLWLYYIKSLFAFVT